MMVMQCHRCGYLASTVAEAHAHQDSPEGGKNPKGPCWNEWKAVDA